jgi:hypothetical protein
MDLSRMSLMMMKVMKGGNKGTRFRGFGGMWDRIDSNFLPNINTKKVADTKPVDQV